MKESAALHRLTHSLTQNEKRYFTLFASAHRDSSDYLKIFKAVDGQKGYNELQLKEMLSGDGGVAHFAVKKNQLYRLLLRALRNYHEGRTFDTTLKEMMLNASILSDKALYQDCYSILNRAREIAHHYEEWKTQLEILHRRYTILYQLSNQKEADEEAAHMTNEEDMILEKMNNYGLLGKLTIQLSLLLKKPRAESDNAIKKLMRNKVLLSEKNALSFRGKSLYYVIHSNYLIHAGKFRKATLLLKKHITLYEKFPQFIEASPGNYLSAFKELLELNFRLKRFDEAKRLIEQLRRLPDNSHVKKIGTRRFRQFIFSWTFRIEISMAIQEENLASLKSHIHEQEEYFSRIEKAIEPENRLETRLALAAFYFFTSDQKQSIHHLQKIFSDKEGSRFYNIQLQAMMMHWFIHFEEGNRELIDYLFSPIIRLTQKQKKLALTQRLMLEFMKQIMKEPSVKQRRSILSQYEKKFRQLKKRSAESHLYDFFDITLWLKNVR